MVQSYQSPVRVYKNSFELIMAAYEKRFPTCDMIPIMAQTEIIREESLQDGEVTLVSRRCTLHCEVPYLLKKIMGVDFLYFVQTNTLHHRDRVLEIEAYNESYANRVEIMETCKYSVHPENPDWTCFEQSAKLDVKSFFGFESTVERLCMKQYSANISRGKEIIGHFLEVLRKEGVTEVPRWTPPSVDEPKGAGSTPGGTEAEEEVEDVAKEVDEKKTDDPEKGENERKASIPKTESVSLEEGNGRQYWSDGRLKLDADYIARCLGDLTPLQESRLVQLKKFVLKLHKTKAPNDTTLLRFLKARDFHLEKSREMLSQSLHWRKKFQVDKLLQDYQPSETLKKYFPGGWHGHDRENRPLYLLRLGQVDVKGISRSVGEEGFIRYSLAICEEGLRLTQKATQELGRPITTWCLLIDLEGLNMRHLWRPGIRTLLTIIEMVENNYPETMSHVLIIRAPRVFPVLWTLVSTFIDEHTRSKFLFYSGHDYMSAGGLVDYIAEEHIPPYLGGKSTVKMVEGGLVPKSLYLPGEELEKSRQHLQLSDHNIYRSTSLSRGPVHEVVLHVEEMGSVICWDFDVMKGGAVFSLIRTSERLKEKTAPSSPPATPPTEDKHDHKGSVIEKGWREGVDFYFEEKPFECHDGESLQGSHVTKHSGSYVLQWRETEPASGLDLISPHKVQLMYHFEVLKGADYRGSMSSLQSCTSGFSSLSSNTTSKSLPSSCPSSCPSR